MRHTLALLAVLALSPVAVRAEITLLGVAALPGDASDRSGLSGKQADGTPNNRLGGLSAIAYTGRGNEYLHLADRGPMDGATDFACRFHRIDVHVQPDARQPVRLEIVSTTLLRDQQGRQYVGSLNALDPKHPEKSLRLDSEGLRVGRNGHLFVSDEYGPHLLEFDASGKQVRALKVPPRFRPAKPSRVPEEELPPTNTLGRQPNRGMEGLAISPDGGKLYGILQSPLIQDGGVDENNKRVGLNCRLLEVDRTTGKTREFVYPLDEASNGINEILAINDHEFLVLERDSKGGTDAKYKKLVRIDLTGATDVSAVEALPTTDLPKSIVPVKKKPFLDLLAPKFQIVGSTCPEKFEGLTFGPDLPDGRRLLLVTSDNDFVVEQQCRVYAFAIDRAELSGFVAQQFDATRP